MDTNTFKATFDQIRREVERALIGQTDLVEHALIALLARERPAALCVSVTMSFNLERARALISAVRARPELNSVRIVVGGLPFQEQPDLGQAIGADETFLDAREGVRRLRRLGPDPSKDDERP